jgi:hypothetical protein
MNRVVPVSLLMATMGVARETHAELEMWSPRLELSLSAAVVAPFGSSEAGVSLSDEARAAFPIGFGAGLRIWRLYAGLEGDLGFGVMGDSPPERGICYYSERDGHERCSVRLDTIVGVVRFHALTARHWDVWIGLGYGREWLHFGGKVPLILPTDPSSRPLLESCEPRFALTGWWLDARLGIDYLPLAWMRIGVFGTFASGQYAMRDIDPESCPSIPLDDVTIDDPAFHHWAGGGLRFAVVVPQPDGPWPDAAAR